ncbi:YdcF family protein [Luteolibacter yonseiensis]|uniref:YdcF family protein n=1 Tax=Luteolibacter yonseiensis TaxID=1144680 RepID=A0A934R833_9BACT|nr:YdcF family protein [Luteolibacter yonseiensis]MBK1817663.1 YdcF family protein [Luteolibacter yonseiensis]
MRHRFRKIAVFAFLAGLVWLLASGCMIWRFGAVDHAVKSDCIIVLGAAVQGGVPSPVFEERIRHAIGLRRAGHASKLLFTGGFGDGRKHSEGAVGRMFAIGQGVPTGDILIEERSHTTRQNLSEAKALMDSHALKTAIIVSDPLHMKRALTMADGLGLEAVSSPTPTTRYRSLRARLGFLVREIYFFHHYLITGN